MCLCRVTSEQNQASPHSTERRVQQGQWTAGTSQLGTTWPSHALCQEGAGRVCGTERKQADEGAV